MHPSKSDDVHLGQGAGVFLHEDMIGCEEVPRGCFDFSKWDFGADFEADNDTLVSFLSDSRAEEAVKSFLLFREVFDVNLDIVGCVEEHTGRIADKLGKEFLEEERRIGEGFFQGELDPGIVSMKMLSGGVRGVVRSGCGSRRGMRHGRLFYELGYLG